MNRTDLNSGERQVSPTIQGIRRDHVARYEFARDLITARNGTIGQLVVDAACGVGYGSSILAERNTVIGVDNSEEAIAYANAHYKSEDADFEVRDITDSAFSYVPLHGANYFVCFETIEHVANPVSMLRNFNGDRLIASVPNESVFPFAGQQFHHRHYTHAQFADLLAASGWSPLQWFGQKDPFSEVVAGLHGWTIIVEAVRL